MHRLIVVALSNVYSYEEATGSKLPSYAPAEPGSHIINVAFEKYANTRVNKTIDDEDDQTTTTTLFCSTKAINHLVC